MSCLARAVRGPEGEAGCAVGAWASPTSEAAGSVGGTDLTSDRGSMACVYLYAKSLIEVGRSSVVEALCFFSYPDSQFFCKVAAGVAVGEVLLR